MNSLSSQFIVDILRKEMDLDAQNIWLRNQNKVIPNDNGLYISVGIVSAITVSNISYMEQQGTDPNFEQHQISQLTQRENVQIDIFSRSNDCIMRNWEVVAALQSIYAQQVQENNNFTIFRIPQSFLDTSLAEGGSMLNRYTITICCMVWYRKDVLLESPFGDYYDDFTTRVDDEQTIGTDTPLFEFEINEGGIVP